IAFIPVLALIRAAKISENSLDYSLNNTAPKALFLTTSRDAQNKANGDTRTPGQTLLHPTSRDAKYKAKAAIDTFFVRAGDLSSAGLVYIGTLLALQPRDFALINMVLTLVWLWIVMRTGRRHRVLVETHPEGETLAT